MSGVAPPPSVHSYARTVRANTGENLVENAPALDQVVHDVEAYLALLGPPAVQD